MLILGGCAAQYGQKGMNGGYSDKPINRTSYVIRYDGSPLLGAFSNHGQLAPLWNKRAQELCGSHDYFQETRNIRFDPYGNESIFGTPAIYGVVYCNNKFMDTRKQSHEENFIKYINMSREAITYKEISPLWDMLINREYKELQEEIDKLYATLSEDEISGLLDTFSRVNPAAEEFLNEWVEFYPNSFSALYSRSIFYHKYSWYKRGNRLWKDVTEQQKAGFRKYRNLAKNDLDSSLKLNSKFCPSHSVKLQVHTSIPESKGAVFEAIFETAKNSCPDSIGVHSAYLRYLLPRWSGTKEMMRGHIDESKEQNEKLEVLEALYLAEEGDQLLFDNKPEEALEKYNEAILFGNFSSIYHQRALVLENLGRYIEAIENYDIAVKLSPYHNSAYEGLTRVLMKQNNLVGALLASSYLTAMNNQDPRNFERVGNIFYHMRRHEDALVSFKKAAILSSNKAVHRHKIKMTEFQIKVRKNEKKNQAVKMAI